MVKPTEPAKQLRQRSFRSDHACQELKKQLCIALSSFSFYLEGNTFQSYSVQLPECIDTQWCV